MGHSIRARRADEMTDDEGWDQAEAAIQERRDEEVVEQVNFIMPTRAVTLAELKEMYESK